MGFKISMADVANFGSGFLDANAKNTANNLKLRQQELEANREFIVAQKKDKYKAELELYKEEKKKASRIQRLNDEAKAASADGGSYDAQLYGNRYLLATLGAAEVKVLKDANPESFQRMALDIGSNPKDFKFSLSRDMIDKQAQADVSIINSTFANEMKNAKGEDALANKLRGLVGMKKQTTEDVQAALEEKLKAGKLVEEIVQEPTDLSGISLKVSSYRGKPPKEYQTAFADVKKAAIFKSLSDKDNLNGFIGLSKKLGFGSEMNFKFDNKDSKIVGIGDSANAFLETYKKAYDNILNSYTDTDLYNINKNRNSISSIINEQEIKRQVENMMIQRENVLTTGEGFNLTSNKQLMAIIPLNIVDTSNRSIINGKPVSINIPESNKKYNEFLKMKAKSAYGTYEGDVGIRNLIKVQNVLENDKFGNGPLSQELKKVLVIEKPTEDTSKNNVPPKPTQAPKSKIQITSEGLLSDRGLLRWESPQIQNRIDSLTPAQKKAYDEWKVKGGKNNTKTKSLSNPSYMRPAKPDIITPKVKEFMQDTKKTEGEFGSGA